MNSINNLNKYLNTHQMPIEADVITKDLIRSHFEDLALKGKWSRLLKDHFEYKREVTDSIDGQLNNDHSEPHTDQNTKSGIKSKKSRYLIFALIALTLGAIIFGLSKFTPNTGVNESRLQALLNDQYANPVPRELMKGVDNDITTIQNAYALYQAKDYNAAIPLLQEISSDDPLNEEHRFYLGLSYLYNKEAIKATQEFDWIINQENSNRKDVATWYMALALTDAGDYIKAKPYLETVSAWDSNSGKITLANEAKLLLELIKTE